MNSDLSGLLKSYNNLPELSQHVVDVLIVKYSGVLKYDVARFFQDKIGNKTTQKEYLNILNALIIKELGSCRKPAMIFLLA